MYRERNDVEGPIEALRTHVNTAEYYYTIWALNPEELHPIARASRFLYLNKTTYPENKENIIDGSIPMR